MRSTLFAIAFKPGQGRTKHSGASLRAAYLHWLLTSCALFFCAVPPSIAAAPCAPLIGHIATAEGTVELQRSTGSVWSRATPDTPLCQGDTVRTGEGSRATVALVNQTILRIDQNSAIQFSNVIAQKEERSIIDLLRGALQSFSRKPRRMTVNTPYLNGAIEGTEFVFVVEAGRTTLTVFEGTVIAANSQGQLPVHAGEAVSAAAGQAPVSVAVVKPRDAAQWSLYYPPILSGAPDAATTSPAQQALFAAAQSLAVGRVPEARASIDQALARDAKLGSALALRAIINVVQNNRAEALADAQQAVALSPDATGPWIALSYAQQAGFQIAEARDSLLRATEKQPQDALAWARLAELQLMLGERDRSAEAANKAATLAPNLERAHLATGFAALAEFRIADARAAFEQAITLDSADPLPHLGLGLAKINAGALEEGRREIEVAVALDSNSALLRAYLGKAYFEETRAPLDAEQFAIAKQLDPLDPTAYFYDGIRKQTENRPVEALEDLEKSAELNDNRATYRGRLLLDKDRAARGVSLARAYDDLGFTQLATNEAAQSLALDPSNASAHRFLADAYRGSSRQEISRVSELLQAQLLQDINIAPVQPSLGEASIAALGGPAGVGFNEFTPLFQRNMAQANLSALVGSNDTHAGEMAVSGIYDRLSLSAGAYSYRTDGYRPNNNLKHDVYNLFAQFAVSPEVNLQAEFRQRNTESGDILAQFDPNYFRPIYRKTFDEQSIRLGARITPTTHSTILLSAITADRSVATSLVDNITYDPLSLRAATATTEDVSQLEGQYLFIQQDLNLVLGTSSSRIKQHRVDNSSLIVPFVGEVPFSSLDIRPDVEDTRAYAYGTMKLAPFTLTLGLSYSNYEQRLYQLDISRSNPKLGLQWDINSDIRLRAAAFKTTKPALATNRTLEPTQIGGFNQFFDDANATKSTSYGIGLDWHAGKQLAAGVEGTIRRFDEAILVNNLAKFESRSEWRHRAYAYWSPAPRWALRAEALYDRYASEQAPSNNDQPRFLKTVTVPLEARYFLPQGLFGGLRVTLVGQEVDRTSCVAGCGSEHFSLADFLVGYRLPQRMGQVTLGIYNLFDRSFKYQGNVYRAFQDEAQSAIYLPERTVMGTVSLNF